jgi:hypothetical protein
LSVTQVSPHEIAVVEEQPYMQLWSEMDDGTDDAPEEPDAADTVCIPLQVHFGKQLACLFVLKCSNLMSDFRIMVCRTQPTISMSKTTTQRRRRQAFWVLCSD